MTRYKHSILLLPLLVLATPALAQGPSSTIVQHGLTNGATINQSDGGNVAAEIVQSGENLAATITQHWDRTGLYPDVANTASINQSGGINTATIDQAFSNDGDANEAFIGQGASSNLATIEQDAGVNSARINQSSVSNLATVSQQLSIPGGTNLIIIDQAGIGSNTANVSQFAYAGTTHIVQDSSFSIANVDQYNGGHDAQIRQFGALQTAEILQLVPDQYGNGALSTINQSGIGNSAVTTQSESSYSSEITQDGTGNSATVDQHGETGWLVVQQFGSNNIATAEFENSAVSSANIRQEGEDHIAKFVNNSSLSDTYIAQYGTGHIATVTQ